MKTRTLKHTQQEAIKTQRLIAPTLSEYWETPELVKKFHERLRREETSRKIAEQATRRKALIAQQKELVHTVMDSVQLDPEAFKSLTYIEKLSSGFKSNSSFLKRSSVLDANWQASCAALLRSLSKLPQSDIEKELVALQRRLEQNFNAQAQHLPKSKNNDNTNDSKEKSEESGAIHSTALSTASDITADIVDDTEDNFFKNFYKIATFLDSGEYEVTFWQRMNIFCNEFKQFIVNPSAFMQSPSRLSSLATEVREAVDNDDLTRAQTLIASFYQNEERKMKEALTQMRRTLEEVSKKDDDKMISDIMSPFQKKITGLYKEIKNFSANFASIDNHRSILAQENKQSTELKLKDEEEKVTHQIPRRKR